MASPLFLKIQDPVVRAYHRHIYLSAHRYKYGWIDAKTGRSRSGKTETNVLQSVLLSRTGFDMRNVGWKPKEYAEVVNDAKPGEPVVWTEVGRGMNARKWQSLQNIISGELMQIMQKKKLIVFIDVINLAFVDSQIRNMIRTYGEVFRPEDNPAYMNVYTIFNNYRTGETWYPHPMVRTDEGFVKLRRITFVSRLKDVDHKVYDDFMQKDKSEKMGGIRKAAKMLGALGGESGEENSVFDYINEIKKDREMEMKYVNSRGQFDWKLIKTQRGLKKVQAEEIAAFLNNEKDNEMRKRMAEKFKKT